MVAVVSAMGKTTDELIALAHEIAPPPERREMDMLLSAGERISVRWAMALEDLGQDALSFTGSQAGILTDIFHSGPDPRDAAGGSSEALDRGRDRPRRRLSGRAPSAT